ncbi:hypothetical protein [Pedobacter nototheniae]|uniref:hypothetical protein n=1 Tax=Pedobacter nototheniae TaxID=2488994 RepID=UPI00103E9241|nr:MULTISPECIES: hypothetical protein [Pedobacter]
MFDKLDYRKKQIALAFSVLLLLYIAYQCSFKNALEAFRLNKQLSKENISALSGEAGQPQLERKSEFYLKVVKSYKVKGEDHENYLWQSLSGMAMACQVKISFNQDTQAKQDTTANVVLKKVFSNEFSFTGNYFNLVRLADTLSKSTGIGKIAKLKIHLKKSDGTTANKNQPLIMDLALKGLIQ